MKSKMLFFIAIGGTAAALNFAPAGAESSIFEPPGNEVCRPIVPPTTTQQPTTTTQPPTTTTEVVTTSTAPPTTVELATTSAADEAVPSTPPASGYARRPEVRATLDPNPLQPFTLTFNVTIDGTEAPSHGVHRSVPPGWDREPCKFKVPHLVRTNVAGINYVTISLDFKGWLCDKPKVKVDGKDVEVVSWSNGMSITIVDNINLKGSSVRIDLQCAAA